MTAVAAFNAIVIGLGALVLGVSHAGSIALVNFVAAYVPYLGAWSAGAFTVLVTLGSQGSQTALVMAVIVLLANGALQQMIQPIAFGATLHVSADLPRARAQENAAAPERSGGSPDAPREPGDVPA